MSFRKFLFPCSFCLATLVLVFVWRETYVSDAITQYLLAIQSIQRGLHTSLSDALRAIQDDGFRASLILIMLSFIYGVFHAAGPGHGKIIISTYLLSHGSQVRRGVILSFAAATVQGLTAILIVCSAFWLLGLSMRQTRGIVNHVEVVSFAMIALVGLYITCTHILIVRRKGTVSNKIANSHHHDTVECDHNHGPSARDLEKELSIRSFIGIVLSIGIRPCSGAVIVLLLAFSLGQVIAGLFAVLAMSLGTAVTITLLAIFSVYFRQAAQRLLTLLPGQSSMGRLIINSMGIFGGGLIFIFGLSFFCSALMAPVHPFR